VAVSRVDRTKLRLGSLFREACMAESAWPAPPRYYLEPRREPPPPPPANELPLMMYGVPQQAFGTLPDQPDLPEQLYRTESDDKCGELRRLNRQLLGRFLELLRVAQEAPGQCSAKVEQIRILLINMQHLINTFRAYQAREDLISIMQAQVDAKQKLVDQLQRRCAEVAVQDAGATVACDVAAGAEAEDDAADSADAIVARIAAEDARDALSALAQTL